MVLSHILSHNTILNVSGTSPMEDQGPRLNNKKKVSQIPSFVTLSLIPDFRSRATHCLTLLLPTVIPPTSDSQISCVPMTALEDLCLGTTLPCPTRGSLQETEVFQELGGCNVSPKQEAAGEKLAPKTQKAAPRERHTSPEPVKMITWESWQRALIPWKSRLATS